MGALHACTVHEGRSVKITTSFISLKPFVNKMYCLWIKKKKKKSRRVWIKMENKWAAKEKQKQGSTKLPLWKRMQKIK